MKAKNQEIPLYMKMLWDDEHSELIKRFGKLKYALEAAKK